MKILVTGYKGMIGSALVNRGAEPLDCDVTDIESVQESLIPYQREKYTVINCAVKKDVDWCEDRKNHKEVFSVNVSGVHHLAYSIGSNGSLLQISSCHVFSGSKYWPYSENHTARPVNQYGYSKLVGESFSSFATNSHLVVRLGTVYDDEQLDRIASLPPEATVPSFLKRNFAHVEDVSDLLLDLCYLIPSGDFPGRFYNLLHVGNSEQNYSYDLFYSLVRDKFGKDKMQSRNRDFKNKYAPRPYRCALNLGEMKKLFPDRKFRSL